MINCRGTRGFTLLIAAAMGLSLSAVNAHAQTFGDTRGTTNGAIGAFGGDGPAGGNVTAGEISTSAGSAEGVNREFGEGFTGRADTAGRFVGNEGASPVRGRFQPADFRNLDRQRATPPPVPGSPVRPTLRLRLRPPLAAPRYGTNLIQESAADTRRAVAGLSPSLGLSFRGDAAVLTGSVDSTEQKRLAEALMRLQPGVRRVENRAVVRPVLPPGL